MIPVPLLANGYLQEYFKAVNAVVSLETKVDSPEEIVAACSVDYQNFVILATLLGKAFRQTGRRNAIRDGIGVFADTLRENVLSAAVGKFYAKVEEEKSNGVLYETYAAFHDHLVILDDLLRLPYARLADKIVSYGGKIALRHFDDIVREFASSCDIEIEIGVDRYSWNMHSNYDGTRCLFFETEADEGLFRDLLIPCMREFYGAYKI